MMSIRLKKLATQQKRIFRIKELGLLWDVQNKANLRNIVSQYAEKGLLFRIYKGLYSAKPIELLDKFEIACAVAGKYSYVTTETVLALEGAMMQWVHSITVVGVKNRDYQINGERITVRAMSRKYLLNRKGVDVKDNYAVATLERAVADLEYYNPKAYLDIRSSIDEEKLKEIKLSVYNK